MKKLIVFAFALSLAVPSATAGALRHGVKPAAKAAAFPFKHPKKAFKAAFSGVRKTSHAAKVVVD